MYACLSIYKYYALISFWCASSTLNCELWCNSGDNYCQSNSSFFIGTKARHFLGIIHQLSVHNNFTGHCPLHSGFPSQILSHSLEEGWFDAFTHQQDSKM